MTAFQNTAFEDYVAPARAGPGWWRVLVGLLLILLAWVAGMVLVGVVWVLAHWAISGDLGRALASLEALGAGGSPAAIVVLLLSFCGIWAGVALALAGLHGQRFGTVFGPKGRGGFWRGALAGLVFSGLSLAISIASVGAPVPAKAFGDWALLFVPLCLLVFVQATAEELMFRGYLLQQLAARVRSPLVWAVLPSLIFGLLHTANAPTLELSLYYVAITAVTGVTFAALVWRAGSLWPAAGMHVAINIVSLTLVGGENILSGTQLYLFRGEDVGRVFAVDMALSLAVLALVLSPAGRWFAPRAASPPARADIR